MWRRAGAAALVLALTVVLGVLGAGPVTAAPELRLSPASGPPGSTVTIEGTGFPADNVEIRWGTQSGMLLTTASGPDFSVTATVPENAEFNSYPIVAVVPQGSGVLTSNASYQVTPTSSVPVDTTVPVVTTVPVTTTPLPAARDTAAPARGGGVDGGADPVMTATAEPTAGSPAPGAAGAAAAAAGATADATAGPTTTTVTPSGAGAAGAGATGGGATPAPPALSAAEAGAGAGAGGAGVDDAGRALGPAASSQSSGVVRSPGLLVAGLGLALAGVVVLLVRNRQRLGS